MEKEPEKEYMNYLSQDDIEKMSSIELEDTFLLMNADFMNYSKTSNDLYREIVKRNTTV